MILKWYRRRLFCADSHENDADVGVSFTHRSRHAALHLAIASVRAAEKYRFPPLLSCDRQWPQTDEHV